MVILNDISKCSGCHACYNICPMHCITMQADNEGFLYPIIDSNLCIECGRCKNKCPINNIYNGNTIGKAYSCYSKNDLIRENSSSGGLFTLIAEYIISRGGIVFGVAFDEKLNVHHISVDNKEDLAKLRGSKYIQSSIGNAFKEVKDNLDKNRIVLFSGTPCQISGIKAYLGKEYDNLFLQDIICHGVPSPKVWQEYLSYISKKTLKTIEGQPFLD